ncbi:Crp/Fnr family transcriptional regulator [Candidatus Acetothermia bacterium]|nr:Crp/Fnr family transcriptional regulator [Candidatus Acetothermia bacterium]
MKTKQEHPLLWCLEDVDLVEDLSRQQKKELLHRLKTEDYQRGETIFLPGDPSDTVYFLHKGLVKIYRVDETGKRLTLLLIGRKGRPFGVMALAGQGRRDLVAQAVIDSRLCMIAKDDLLLLAKANPTLCLKITELIGSRRKTIENKLADVVFRNVPARLAKLLLQLAREFGREFQARKRIEIRFTHQELAELIGASREHVTATLNRFSKERLLSRRRGHVILQNEKALRQLVDARG